MTTRWNLPFIIACIAASACASGGASPSTSSANPAAAGEGVVPQAAPANHDRSVLTNAELRATNEKFLYDLIQRQRPEWLRTHGNSSIAQGLSGNTDADRATVYQDREKIGTVELLRQIDVSSVTSVRFYTPAQAQLRFGTGNVNGVIQLITTPNP